MPKPRLTTLGRRVATIDTRVGMSATVDRIRGYKLRKIRERIALRDEYTCQMCGRAVANGEVDHKVPLHLGGLESDDNRWWLCPACHSQKTEKEMREIS